jgi:hypothetical protein
MYLSSCPIEMFQKGNGIICSCNNHALGMEDTFTNAAGKGGPTAKMPPGRQ